MSLSTVCFAGGHVGGTPLFHGGAHFGGSHVSAFRGSHRWGGFREARGFGSLAGFGMGRGAGVFGTRYGHTNTAFSGNAGRFARSGMARWAGRDDAGRFGRDRLGYGRRRLASYAFGRRGLYGYGAILPGSIGAGGYGYGYGNGYGYGDVGPEPGYAASDGYGYAEPPLAATYAEPPLGAGPYPGDDDLSFDGRDAGYGPSAGYGGGPRIISVRADDRPRRHERCFCRRDSAEAPIVYRFGVGSYY